MFTRKANIMKLIKSAHITRKHVSTEKHQNDKIIVQNHGNHGIITINRPRDLNAIDADMIKKIFFTLEEWQKKKKLVIIKGAGKNAFCAGGDIKSHLGHESIHVMHKMILLMHSYRTPIVALMNGVVMGAGMGLSCFNSHRVATERTIFAMPETKLGFFPNCGASYIFPRLEANLGWYLGLTTNQLTGSDVVRAGLASHFCKSDDLPNLEAELLRTTTSEDVEKVLARFNINELPKLSHDSVKDSIKYCFSSPTVEAIIKRLEEDGSSWAKETLNTLNQLSPTSLKVTLKALQLGSKMNLKECLTMEYRLNMNFINYSADTRKGVLAFKTGKVGPVQWDPSKLADVSEEYVDGHFARCPSEEPL